MIVLVINSGSSSIKYQLIDMPEGRMLASGLVERIGLDKGRIKHHAKGKESIIFEINIHGHKEGIEKVLEILLHPDIGSINSIGEIEAVGHRVVHAGEDFSESVVINANVLSSIEKNAGLAPLHNPANLLGIEVASAILPGVPQVAVFDTAFHQSIPSYAYLYAIPYVYYEKMKIRKYGFHGTSHRYVVNRAARMLDKDLQDLKLISCHLGNGASVAAVRHGQSIDTSLGLTPNEGLIMGTRSGDIDSGAVFHIMKEKEIDVDTMNNILNKKSGVYGISGISPDMRELEEAAKNGNPRATLALDMYVYRLLKYTGAYHFALQGADAIIFTGGVGENSAYIRERIMKNLEFLNIIPDYEANAAARGKETFITKKTSPFHLLVIPTNEELLIASDTYELVVGN